MRAYCQGDVTDHQLHDQVYYGHDNYDQDSIFGEDLNVLLKCKKNNNQTLESEEDGMQDHCVFFYGNV